MRNLIRSSGDNIDLARADMLEAPPPKRASKRKPVAAPVWVEPWAEQAKAKMLKRPPSPGVALEPKGSAGDAGRYEATSPHDDHRAWELQICDAFATRSQSTVRVFMRHLQALCADSWDEPNKRWKPSETELNAALNFVSSIRPRNETEAALGAQMLAIHWMTMRVSAQALTSGYVDPRTAAVAGKLARTFAEQMDTLRRGRGGKSSKQTIIVRKENHVHYHDHRGGADSGAQPHAPAHAAIDQCATLPGEGTIGTVVRLPCREG